MNRDELHGAVSPVPPAAEGVMHSRRPKTARTSRQLIKPLWEPVKRPTASAPTSDDINNEKGTTIPKLPPPAPGNAHKRYSSVYPCANRLLAKRWDDAARERHRQKLATMKPYIDNTPPKKHGHLQLRLKKLQLEDGTLSFHLR
jgi:hypothetical protein